MSVCLSIRPRMEQVGPHWTDFHEILYLNIFRKSVEKIQFLIKHDKNNGYSQYTGASQMKNLNIYACNNIHF